LIRETTTENQEAGPAFPLDITISAPSQIFVRGRGLDTEFAGDLRVTGTTKDVLPIGGFNLVRGRLDLLGQRLDIEEASITLQGSFVPVLRIIATSVSDDYTINVNVLGPAENPEISFTSEPELPEEEVLARLLFGQGLDSLSPFQAARLVVGARTLAGQGGEGLVGNIRSGVGLADLNVNTNDEGATEVRAGAYLSEDIYTDVTLGSDGNNVINLNYDFTETLTLKGSAANSGETSVGIIFQKDY
jgi:translocation and assembly module TamB